MQKKLEEAFTSNEKIKIKTMKELNDIDSFKILINDSYNKYLRIFFQFF